MFKILCKSPPEYVDKMNLQYAGKPLDSERFLIFYREKLDSSPYSHVGGLLDSADKHGITLVKMLAEELSGISKEAALFMIGMKIKPYEEIAKLIEKAVRAIIIQVQLFVCEISGMKPCSHTCTTR